LLKDLVHPAVESASSKQLQVGFVDEKSHIPFPAQLEGQAIFGHICLISGHSKVTSVSGIKWVWPTESQVKSRPATFTFKT